MNYILENSNYLVYIIQFYDADEDIRFGNEDVDIKFVFTKIDTRTNYNKVRLGRTYLQLSRRYTEDSF